MKKNRRIVMPLLVFILVIGGWELYVRVFDISLYILPSPSKIISALIDIASINMTINTLGNKSNPNQIENNGPKTIIGTVCVTIKYG